MRGSLLHVLRGPRFTVAVDSEPYSLLLQWHLGLPLVAVEAAGRPCPTCGGAVDPFGDHSVSCGHAAFGKRHLGIQMFLCRALSNARVPHDREVAVTGDLSRPADVLLKEWSAGKDLAVDLTVVHPAAVSAPRPATGSAQAFLAQAARLKCQASERKCAEVGVGFTPMIFDTWEGSMVLGGRCGRQWPQSARGAGCPNPSPPGWAS